MILCIRYKSLVMLCSAAATLASGGNDFLDQLQLGRVDVNFTDSPALVPLFYWTTVPNYERWREVGLSLPGCLAGPWLEAFDMLLCATRSKLRLPMAFHGSTQCAHWLFVFNAGWHVVALCSRQLPNKVLPVCRSTSQSRTLWPYLGPTQLGSATAQQ